MSLPSSDESATSSDCGIYPDINRNDICFGKTLGCGSFGTVFSAIWTLPDGQKKHVALKKVFVLEKEAEILSKIRHKNIIQFYGVCKSTTSSDFLIVTECAERGSLYDHIHSANSNPYSFDDVIKWATQIANGIHYLHYDAVDTIIHRDLKSKNVVLNSSFVCKICDFGTSKDLTHSCTAPSWGGTAAWMSPEMILQTEKLTISTDVWSYGVVLWEILSHEVPYKDYSEFRIFSLITQNGITLAIPESCPIQLKQLMKNCWKMEPKNRINMRQILTELIKMEHNQKVMDECEKFLENDNWQDEIEKQKKNVEKMRKNLEKRQEKLELREKALKQRMNLEQAVIASARQTPEDVHQWSEHHTSQWIDSILGRVEQDQKFLDRVNAAVFRHRITGVRLLEMSQNDLEYLGVQKLGSRIELMKAIRKLSEHQTTLCNFPTLEQAKRITEKMKTEKDAALGHLQTDISLILIIGIYTRKNRANIKKFKLYVDSDWSDENEIPQKFSSKHSSSFIKTVCFSILNLKTKKPMNEPICTLSSGMTSSPDWITADADDDDDARIKCIINIYYSDNVTQPRNTEIVLLLDELKESRILCEQSVLLKFRRCSTPKLSTSPLHAPNQTDHSTQMMQGFHHAISTPQLKGFWQRKATMQQHGLTESELSNLHENLRSIERKEVEEEEEEEEEEEKEEQRNEKLRRRIIHGGRDKWTWRKSKSKPKFS